VYRLSHKIKNYVRNPENYLKFANKGLELLRGQEDSWKSSRKKQLRSPVPPLMLALIHPRICAVSSVVEHYLDTVGVTGSNPVSRTIFDPSGR
jgi:hypothetical protein